jgi:apolipoprotein N-acyltransferase
MNKAASFFATHAVARWILAFAAGAAAVRAMPPWGWWPALALGLSILYWLAASAKTARGAALAGGLWGFGYFVFGLSWIGNALLVDGNDYAWAWPLAVAGLPLLLALFPAAGCALFRRVTPAPRRLPGFAAFVFWLCLSEWARGHLFTGFPWNLFGYSWANLLPVAQLAAAGGIYFLTLVTAFWAALPGWLLFGEDRRAIKAALLILALGSFAAAYACGHHRLAESPTRLNEKVAVRIVQPNILQTEKWDPQSLNENLDRLLTLSEKEPVNDSIPTMIVWPETALTYFQLARPGVLPALKTMLGAYKMPVVLATGYLRRVDREHYFNSVTVFDKNMDPLVSYDKSHLVPFGEYIPFQKWIPLRPVVQFTGFVPGAGPQILSVPEAGNFSFLVCYEVIFPGAVLPPGGERPDAFINVTNDAWYGDTSGPRQHFAAARFRAIEEGIPVVRSANTGISGAIDPEGRIVYATNLMEMTARNVALPLKREQATLYGRYGDTVFWIFLLVFGSLSPIFQYIQTVLKYKLYS